MAFLDAATIERLQGTVVRVATLVELRFDDQTFRLWNGFGTLTIDGDEWRGAGTFGSIDGLQQQREPVSEKVRLKLSGVEPDVLALAVEGAAGVRGRPAYVWLQLFDESWQPVGPKVPIFWGRMQRVAVERSESRSEQGGSRIVAVEVENPFAARARPAARRFTDADQQARHANDSFFEFIPLQRGQEVVWPDY